ncbi:hypothetical protein GCM10010430_17120 [Kitasatospora cystarginea]|uniref:Uncharacterized protein n=1 Tax=Kitasatospora cystarginea TaxID=58350 RepID=A0ABP5QI48_9ACTN
MPVDHRMIDGEPHAAGAGLRIATEARARGCETTGLRTLIDNRAQPAGGSFLTRQRPAVRVGRRRSAPPTADRVLAHRAAPAADPKYAAKPGGTLDAHSWSSPF